MTLAERYDHLCKTPSSINEHLPVLRHYAYKVQRVAEFGVDIGQSTTAFLMAAPEILYSYDVALHPELAELTRCMEPRGEIGLPTLKSGEGFFLVNWQSDKLTRWNFLLDDSRTCNIPEVDLLLIDSSHYYDQVKTELSRHHQQVRQFIICHDTVSFGELGEDGRQRGILPAIREFQSAHPEWVEREHLSNNNGLLVLERTNAN